MAVTTGDIHIIFRTGRLIMWNTKHIHSTTIPTEQYLHEQIKKAAGQPEDIFIQTVPVVQIRPPTQHAACIRMEVTHYKDPVDKEREIRDIVHPIKQNSEVSSRHNIYNGCDKQPGCTVVYDKPWTKVKNSLSPGKKALRTRSGWAVCRPLRPRTDM